MKRLGIISLTLLFLSVVVSCSPVVSLGLDMLLDTFGGGFSNNSDSYEDPNKPVISVTQDSLVFLTMEQCDTLVIENLLDVSVPFTIQGKDNNKSLLSRLSSPDLHYDDYYGGGSLYDTLAAKKTEKIPIFVKGRSNVGNITGNLIISAARENTNIVELPVRIETTTRDLTATIKGTVTNEGGTPLNGVTVLLRPDSFYKPTYYTKTADKGNYSFENLDLSTTWSVIIVSGTWWAQKRDIYTSDYGEEITCDFTAKSLTYHLYCDPWVIDFGEVKNKANQTTTYSLWLSPDYETSFNTSAIALGEEAGGLYMNYAHGWLKGEVDVTLTLYPSSALGPHELLLYITAENAGGVLIPVRYTNVE